MASLAAEVVLSDSARRRKYMRAAWCEVYSLARLWFDRLEMSGSNSGKSQRDEREHKSQQRAAIAAVLASHHCDRTRGMMISTTAEKWVGVIADKGDVARKAVWCLTRVTYIYSSGALREAQSHTLMVYCARYDTGQLVVQYQLVSVPLQILQCHHLIN